MDWSTILSWTWLGVILLTLVHIVYSKRGNPDEALVWMMLVVFLPLFGIIWYLFFGLTRINHVELVRRSIRSTVARDHERFFGRNIQLLEKKLAEFRPPPEVAGNPHNRTLDRLFPDSLPLDGNSVEMLTDGNAVYPRMLEDIAGAKHTVRLQSFIINDDEVGRKIIGALQERAAAGVDVKVLFDSFGSLKLYFSRFFLARLFRRQRNFTVRAFSPINLFAPWKFQLRNHKKLLVIDGAIAYSGGINISEANENLATVPANRHIHDLHCRILGPAVSQFSISFFYDWIYTTRRNFADCAQPGDFPLPQRHGDAVLRVLDSGPGTFYMGTQKLFFAAAALARKSLWIMTPYLVPGPEYIDALCMAAARGVNVKIIVPKCNNHPLVNFAARSFFGKLLKSGVQLFEKNGCFSHTKALIVDAEWGFMGSSNCDRRSFRLNFELDFCFERSDFVPTLLGQFYAEEADSTEITLFQVERKSFFRRLAENIFALFTPVL